MGKNKLYFAQVVADFLINYYECEQSFYDFCEGGEIFYNDIDLTETDRKELCNYLMNNKEEVDKMANKIYN